MSETVRKLCMPVGKCSDVEIVVEHEAFKVHSLILCSRSEVFDKILNGGMRESTSKTVHIEDCSATIFKAVLRFLYSDDLNSFLYMDTIVVKLQSVYNLTAAIFC